MRGVKIKFWGVRGSTPAPFLNTIRYGGNTPCVEILSGNNRIVCDAGTGIQSLGIRLARERAGVKASILLSHVHWDHIAGLPFFEPFFQKKNAFEIIGPNARGNDIKESLSKAIAPPYFPVSLSDFAASIEYRTTTDKPFSLGKIQVTPRHLAHPGGALGWRFHFSGGKSLVYVSDNEPSGGRSGLIKWIKGADILIHDAQYTPSEYRNKKGWGHSPYTYPVEIALAAGVKRLILSHFNPPYTDKKLKNMLKRARVLIRKSGSRLICQLAREGKVIYL